MSTTYQRTHHPASRVEVLCTSRKALVRGFCPDCGRHLRRGGRDHKPNRTGALGWVERFGDGSARVVSGAERMPHCRMCDQRDVPAAHTTPLGHDCKGPAGTQMA